MIKNNNVLFIKRVKESKSKKVKESKSQRVKE